MDDHPLSIYLTELDFADTTGQKAPPAWFSSKVIAKTMFTGYPTYIDFDCIIYLHEADDNKFLEKITKKLTETYSSIEPPSVNCLYSIDQACVVKYHVDSKYYRGIIRENINSDLEWGVQFIDYGNVESVAPKDLRPYAPFPNLPALASKYVIDGIKPKCGAEKFTVGELDQMHALLVTKFVSIRINSNELHKAVKRCSMRLGGSDVAENFITRGLAEVDYKPFYPISELEGDVKNLASQKPRKSRNRLLPVPFDDYTVSSNTINNFMLNDLTQT